MKIQTSLVAVYLFFQFAIVASASSGNATDKRALLEFKKMVDYDPRGALKSWNESVHFCGWLGVKCSRRHTGSVTVVNLEGLFLRGQVTPHIGNLTFLRHFNLTTNRFYGEMPHQIGRLRRLYSLDLSNNTFGGEIPIGLVNCSELSIVDLTGNSLVGVIPSELSFLLKLRYLQLSINNLTGVVPPSLGNVSTLVCLSAGLNNLAGNVPEDIGRLKFLKIFAAGINNLSGTIPPSIYNMSSLEILSFAANVLTGTLPSDFGIGLPRLQKLELGDNQLSGQIPASLSNSSRLEAIGLDKNHFSGQLPKSLGNLSELWLLNLEINRLGTNSSDDLDAVAHLANCRKMARLYLAMNYFGGTLLDSIAKFSNQLDTVFLLGNSIHGHIPRALENHTDLLALSVDQNSLTGEIPEFFGKFTKLQGLSLSENRLSGKIPASLGNLTQLYWLDLSQNCLKGSVPPSIGTASSLQFLDLSRNKLSGAIPRQVFSLSSLSVGLVLSRNAVSGSLPAEVGNLKNINLIDLSENNLSGAIPGTIGDCSVLESLYLQGNSFNKDIPSSLASAKVLVNLDLSRNNLSGEIPRKLLELRYLLYLNLSFNDLEGEVPETGIFRNSSAVSLVGNSKLCGGVAEFRLPKCPVKGSDKKMNRGLRLAIVVVCVSAALFLLCSLLLFLYRKKAQNKSSSEDSTIGSLLKVSYQMIHRATDGFSPAALIGAGSFGTVYKGFLGEEENEVAIKVLNLRQKGASKSFVAECNALREIRHRNLVKILTCCSSLDHKGNEFKALVFEYMANGSLDKWLNPANRGETTSRSLSLVQRLDIAADVACALSYLHDHCDQPIIHCDLKPSNILLDSKMVAHINDFGLARLISATNNSSQAQTSTTGIKGTVGYAAPEYAMGGEPSRHGDVYSYGIVVLEMFTGKRPTDEMFTDDFNLHNLVKTSIAQGLVERVAEPALLPREAEASNEMRRCIVSVLGVGLACSVDLPKERMNMGDVARELQHIKNDYIGIGVHGH